VLCPDPFHVVLRSQRGRLKLKQTWLRFQHAASLYPTTRKDEEHVASAASSRRIVGADYLSSKPKFTYV
jgi:hypothetical protein